jgi:hypothetical protein
MIGYGSALRDAGSGKGKNEQAPADVKTKTARDRIRKNLFHFIIPPRMLCECEFASSAYR